jgi:hypothetical protein
MRSYHSSRVPCDWKRHSTCPMAAQLRVRSWPLATNFSLGPEVSFRDEAEVDRAAELAVSVENDPSRPSAARFAAMQNAGSFDDVIGSGFR